MERWIDYNDFQEVKKLTRGRIERLEKQLNNLASVGYENGNIEEKRKKISFAITLCIRIPENYKEKKWGKSIVLDLSQGVIPLGLAKTRTDPRELHRVRTRALIPLKTKKLHFSVKLFFVTAKGFEPPTLRAEI